MEAQKNEANFIKLIKENQRIIHKICYIFCKNQTDQKDLYQEIIIQVWKYFDSFKGRSKFSTWLYKVALNTAVTHTKKKKILSIDKDVSQIYDLYEETSDSDENIKLLQKAISCLNKIEKAIILLWLEERSYEQIAETLGISEKNVSVKLVRIKKKLKRIIEKIQ